MISTPKSQDPGKRLPRVVVVTVVRDKAMYQRCIGDNPVLKDMQIIIGDNTVENRPVPYHYNKAIEAILAQKEPCWIAFIHEDFKPFEPLEEVLADADTAALWGPQGATTKRFMGFPYKSYMIGCVLANAKDGSRRGVYGLCRVNGVPTETFDCACVFAHSSLLERFPTLRFDESCAFDMYAEDLCYQAEQLGIPRRILQFGCVHNSLGDFSTGHYQEARAYCQRKHPTLRISGGSCIAVLNDNFASRFYRTWRFIKKNKYNPIRMFRNRAAFCQFR